MNSQARKIWIISDLHIAHERILGYCNRPSNYLEKVYKNWKELVKEKDVIIDLGDVIFYGNKKNLYNILKKLPGIKILIRGNHDRNHTNTWFFDVGYSFVCNQIVMSKYVFSHSPAKIKEGQINVHGHLHNAHRKKWSNKYKDILTDNHYLYSLEYNNYKPVLLSKAIENKELVKTKEVIWE